VETWKEQKSNSLGDMESVCLAPFFLAVLLSISGKEKDNKELQFLYQM